MNTIEIENNKVNNQINSLLAPVSNTLDSTETAALTEIEDNQPLEKLKNELSDPCNETLKQSCEAALASYLYHIKQQETGDSKTIQPLASTQQEVITALEKAVRYQGHDIRPIDSCYKPCTCCYVIPHYLTEKVQQIEHIKERVFQAIPPPQTRNKVKRAAPHTATKNTPTISVYTANNGSKLPGSFISNINKPSPHIDATAKKALEGAQDVYDFWLKNYGLWSYDNQGSPIKSTVHYKHNYANALWNGKQMVYGDGNNIFTNFTELSIVGHEFGHAVTGNKLYYYGESGALNEHLSDVWGSLVLQFKKKQTVHQASWLIGEGSIKIGKQSYALRSLKAPGTAYQSTLIGKDPQSDHYSKRYIGTEDEGGVHLNSGIPNKAFYLFAKAQGGYAWEKAGLLWYLTLKTDHLLKTTCTMNEFAYATISTALHHFPKEYQMHQNLIQAWKTVGLT